MDWLPQKRNMNPLPQYFNVSGERHWITLNYVNACSLEAPNIVVMCASMEYTWGYQHTEWTIKMIHWEDWISVYILHLKQDVVLIITGRPSICNYSVRLKWQVIYIILRHFHIHVWNASNSHGLLCQRVFVQRVT